MIISFSWTTSAIRRHTKTETRRFWKDFYAKRFKPGSIHQAWTRQARYGGEFICKIRIVEVRKESLSEMSDESFEREGGTEFWKDKRELVEAMLAQGKGDTPWVVRFEYV